MLLGTLGVSTLGKGKRAIATNQGRGNIRAYEEKIRAGQDF